MKNTKTKTNKKVLVIALIVLLLALAVGYAAFSDVLRISGTANAKGTFDLEFQNEGIVTTAGVDTTNTKITVDEDKNTLNVVVADLAYPGAGVEFKFDIKNVGNISADVTDIVRTNITGNDHIKIKGLDIFKETSEDGGHKTLEPQEVCTVHFTVEWDENSTEALTDADKSVNFGLQLQYTQSTKNATFSTNTAPSHTDSNS